MPRSVLHAYTAILRLEHHLAWRMSEFGNHSRTSRMLHNWALRFALNGLDGDPHKDHLDNLRGAPVYATPAAPLDVAHEYHTHHPFPEAPVMYRNPRGVTPASLTTMEGAVTVLQRVESARPGSTYHLALLAPEPLPSEVVVHYGPKRAAHRVLLTPARHRVEDAFQGTVRHPINPLDWSSPVRLNCALEHAMPPSPLFEGRLTHPLPCIVITQDEREYVTPQAW